MILCDFHTHSDNSFDAENSVDEMCRAAIERGLSAIAVTDHCEAPYINCGENCEFGSFDRQIPKSVKDTLEAREKYKGKLKVICGIELGEPMHDTAQTKHALEYADFDFILASVHNLRNRDDFYYMDYSKVDVHEILKEYFYELAETASFEHFDSLSHLTYPLRYIFERTGAFPDLSQHIAQIEEIYKILIKNNKALEINVSGLFQPIKTTLPHQELINLFHDMGGKYVTVGTDAHNKSSVGVGIEKGIEAAKIAGFMHYTVYEKHKTILLPIDL